MQKGRNGLKAYRSYFQNDPVIPRLRVCPYLSDRRPEELRIAQSDLNSGNFMREADITESLSEACQGQKGEGGRSLPHH